MDLHEHSPNVLKVPGAVISLALPPVVIMLTALRLYARGRRRWRWDDAWVCSACFWMILNTPVGIEMGLRIGHLDSAQLALNYLDFFSLLLSLWSCRISILMSIARITPGIRKRRRRELTCIGFMFLCVFEISQVAWICSANVEWMDSGIPKCLTRKQIPITHLVTSCISDAVLIILPLRTFQDLSSKHRRIRIRLSLAFLASICTTALSIAACAVIIASNGFVSLYLGMFEGYTAVIVCNLPVLVVAACHVLGVRDTCTTDTKTLPPIKFASKTGGPDVVGITTEDLLRTMDDQCSFSTATRVPSSSPSAIVSDTVGEATGNHLERSTFLGRLKSFPEAVQDDEDECDEELTSTQV